jgi:hypothetical protein
MTRNSTDNDSLSFEELRDFTRTGDTTKGGGADGPKGGGNGGGTFGDESDIVADGTPPSK